MPPIVTLARYPCAAACGTRAERRKVERRMTVEAIIVDLVRTGLKKRD